MATLIPVDGEMVSLPTPARKADLDRLCRGVVKRTSRKEWEAPDGSAFVWRSPLGKGTVVHDLTNVRAWRFMKMRAGEGKANRVPAPEGPAVYLSGEEWRGLTERETEALLTPPPAEDWVWYPVMKLNHRVRKRLFDLGVKWDDDGSFRVPEPFVEDVERILRNFEEGEL